MLDILFLLIAAYAVVCFGAWRLHRFFVYAPDPSYATPEEAGLDGIEEVRLVAPDGVTLIAWYSAAKLGMPTLLFFTGNGGSAATHAHKVAEIQASGFGLFMLNYRGYGGSGGRPTEAHNIADAALAYDALRQRGLLAQNIVAYGESLGTSVATQLALRRPVKALVLEAPFSSIVAVGRLRWWFLPLKLVMVDQYRTIDIIAGVHVPLLIVHGAKDGVIPLAQAQQVFAAANEPKRMVVFPEADHSDLYEHIAFGTVASFLASLGERPVNGAEISKTPLSADAPQ